MHESSMLLMKQFAQKYVRSPCTVADIGSLNVNGIYRPLFGGCVYTGLDITAGPNVDRVVEKYDFGNAQYDVVISGQCMEHVEDLHRWRDAVIRTLRPGGVLCIIAPHTWSYHQCPIDCWRILPDGMKWLFGELEILECKMNKVDTMLIARKSLCRWDIINLLIQKYGYARYLEIGLHMGDTFDRVTAKHRESVDPVSLRATWKMTSDEFFKVNQHKFDIIFIDGNHECQQVLRDMTNARRCLLPGGTIVMHDCSPPNRHHESLSLCGTVWRAWAEWRMAEPNLYMIVVDADYGCGIIREGEQRLFPHIELLDYSFLERHRQELLNLVPTNHNWV